MFPVYLYEENRKYPENENYYLVAGNGIFFHKHTNILSGLVKVPNVAVLDCLREQRSAWNLKKIPAEIAAKIRRFFKKIVELYDAESCVVLYYNSETETFHPEVTEQFVSKAGVNYKKPTKPGYLMVGTIHSHCDFEAFHSGVDDRDEVYFDGLHCTFGHNDRDDFISVSASVVVNGHRTKLRPEDVIEGIELVEDDFYRLANDQEVDVSEWVSMVRRA